MSKAEGNPLFIEEVIKSLLETGALRKTNGTYALEIRAEDIAVPDTLEEVILSRIDRLHQEAKQAIQLASVIGRDFTVRLLDRISDVEAKLEDVLGELKALELIREKAYFPELSYMFKHALTHQVARSTLLVERRRALHCIVAAAIEELYADRLPEHYEMLALHYYEGEQWEKALDYLVRAGEKTAAVYANQEALDHYARALEVCEKLGDPALQAAGSVARTRGLVNFTIGDFPNAITDFDRMLASARRLGERRLEGMALARRGLCEVWNHEFEKAEETLTGALAVADEGFDDVCLSATTSLVFLHTAALGRVPKDDPLMRAAKKLAPKVDDKSVLAWWGVEGAMVPNWGGRFDQALEHLDRWRAAAEESHQTGMLLMHRWAEALARGGTGEYQQALRILQDIVPTCDRIGEVQVRARALNTIGWIYGELQDHRRATDWNEQGLQAAVDMIRRDAHLIGNARLNLGDSLLARGRLDEAEEEFQKVERVVRNPRPQERFAIWHYSQRLFHSYGELWLAQGDHHKAISYADECVELAESTDRPKNIIKGRRLRGQALLAHGKLDEAQQELATALEIAKGLGNPPQLWKTHAALGDLWHTQGRPDEARQAYRDAASVIEGVASGLTDESLRETFLSSDHVQGIRRAAEVD